MRLKWGKGHISLYAFIKVRAPTIPLSTLYLTQHSHDRYSNWRAGC